MKVTVTVSEPFVKVAGGWTGMRPVGMRREYRANVMGRDFVFQNKAELRTAVKQAVYREEERCRFVHVPVQFEFVPAPKGGS